MNPYEVEVFTPAMEYRSHSLVDGQSYKIDYLDCEKNKMKIPSGTDVLERDYVRIHSDDVDRFEYVSAIERSTEETTITLLPLLALTDVEMLIDTDKMSGTLEEYIARLITEKLISSSDAKQNIDGLMVQISSETNTWALDIEPDNEDDHYAKINLYDKVILPAFKRYGVRLEFSADIMSKKIVCDIGINTQTKIIEADLPNIVSRSISVRAKKKETNKVSLWNKNDYFQQATYYLHSDGTYDMEDRDRLVPVVEKIEILSTKNEETIAEKTISTLNKCCRNIKSVNKKDKKDLDESTLAKAEEAVEQINKHLGTNLSVNASGYVCIDGTKVSSSTADKYFAQITTYAQSEAFQDWVEAEARSQFLEKAIEKVESNFGKNQYTNLIKLEVMPSDPMIEPMSMKIGHSVEVIHDGTSYTSILTGVDVGDTVTLIFGMLRLELTKILKGRT